MCSCCGWNSGHCSAYTIHFLYKIVTITTVWGWDYLSMVCKEWIWHLLRAHSCQELMPKYTPVLKETYSQALLSKRGSDILSQSGKLRGLQQVDTSRRGDVAESPRRCHARPAWGLCDDLSPMVYTGLCVLSEVQLLAVNLFKRSISLHYPRPLHQSPALSDHPATDKNRVSIQLRIPPSCLTSS